MSPRDRRLLSDFAHMDELSKGGRVTFRTDRYPPDEYELMLNGPGLARDQPGALTVRNLHRCGVYLHLDYPRRPPVVTWLTPVFHPNLLGPDRNGGVCIGSWSAAESLADLSVRLWDLVTFRSFNAADALDKLAASWTIRHGIEEGCDVSTLIGLPVEDTFAIAIAGA